MARCVDAERLAFAYMDAAKKAGVEELEFLTPEDVARTILKCADSCEEIAPVIHAHWRLVALNTWDCTNCHYVVERRSRKTIYCPDCGAKMDEEVNDD